MHFQTNPPTCTKFGANRLSRLTASPDFGICDPLPPPPKCPLGIEGRLGFSLCPFPDESADVNQSWCQSIQPFDSFPILLNLKHPNPPPPSEMPSGGIEGRLAFSQWQLSDESADVNQKWCQSDSFPVLFNCWPPKKNQVQLPLVSRGAICLAYIHSYMNLHVCQIWCQSAQPFGSFCRMYAQVSSAFRLCTRWLAQKHAKKQHLYMYIENYNSGPNM